MFIDEPVTALKNVGVARAKLLSRLGVHTVGDLIELYPRDYEDRSQITNIDELSIDENHTVAGIIESAPENMRIKNSAVKSLLITKAKIRDETGLLELVWYNQPYMKNNIKKGGRYLFTGKVASGRLCPQMQVKDYERLTENDSGMSDGGDSKSRVLPLYPLTAGLSQKVLRKLIYGALKDMNGNGPQGNDSRGLEELLPDFIREKLSLADREWAIRNVHFPADDQAFFVARRTLVFEELFLMQISLLVMKGRTLQDTPVCRTNHGPGLGKDRPALPTTAFYPLFPFILTSAQQRVLEEIKQDLQKPAAMSRLVQGDVGCGKTAVAIAVSFMMIQGGFQAAMMAPTEVLARQHLASFRQYLEPLGVQTVLLTGSLKKKEREATLALIQEGKASMILGTHALIQEKVAFSKLGIVITDEQHRFGVKQRGLLSEKGDAPHVLVMSATPIPRTLGLILYGDMDISIIDTLPPGRQKIDTFCVGSNYRERIYVFLQKEIDKGRQVYVICPSIENNSGENDMPASSEGMESVMEYAERLKVRLRGRVEALHGRMKPEEKQRLMDDFLSGSIHLIVSTTVIEVGVNAPNATVMVVENAERFGLSQLHQLRGRVGRGGEKSYCILITDNKGKICQERMKAMTKTQDGFALSELDLKLRGPGDFFGTRQHGLPEMKLANLYRDMDILKEAQAAALNFYREGLIERPEYEGLRKKVERYTMRCVNGL